MAPRSRGEHVCFARGSWVCAPGARRDASPSEIQVFIQGPGVTVGEGGIKERKKKNAFPTKQQAPSLGKEQSVRTKVNVAGSFITTLWLQPNGASCCGPAGAGDADHHTYRPGGQRDVHRSEAAPPPRPFLPSGPTWAAPLSTVAGPAVRRTPGPPALPPGCPAWLPSMLAQGAWGGGGVAAPGGPPSTAQLHAARARGRGPLWNCSRPMPAKN